MVLGCLDTPVGYSLATVARKRKRTDPRSRLVQCGTWLSGLLVLFQILAVVASFQLSGLGHLAGDLIEEMTIGHHHDTSREEDDDPPSHQCPPGCPTCHHVHFTGALRPDGPRLLSSLPPGEFDLIESLRDDSAPSGPVLPSVYRPPRA